jgi:NAD(P)-dependent dehydrogenase (short-subunit alcohol dehydrogenase family)
VVLADINLEAVERGAALIKERYPNSQAIAVKCDVSKEIEIESLVKTTVDKFGRLDVMVSPL